ncbi:MAG: PQQ-binding-like beta-propeller repeat protein, partial [Egicoccus sp.]
MRTSTTVTCPSCDAAWDPGDARFCGDCGARLRPSPTLEGAPLSDAERTEALAPFDPHRLRCEPEGCERWRVDLPGGSRYGRQVAIIEGLVVTLAGDEVRAYDLDSGAEQWRASWPEPSAPPPVAEVALIETQVDGNGASGNAWTTLHDLRALDPRTGALLWTTGSASLRAVSDRAFVVTDGATTRVLHPRTGAERGRGELPGTGWLHLAADVLLHQSDAHDGRWQVLDTESLEVMAELGPLDHLMRTDDGSALVGLDRSDANTGDRVLLFETDGTLRWEHQVTAPAGSVADCCTNPRVEGDD